MEVIAQKLNDIVDSLRPLTVEWQDETSRRVIVLMKALPVKKAYTTEDVKALLDSDFDDGILVCRLFLGISKDQFTSLFRDIRGEAGTGVKSYRANKDAFIESILSTGLLEAMTEEANRAPHWSDVLVERLRSGRGSLFLVSAEGATWRTSLKPSLGRYSGRTFKSVAHLQGHGDRKRSAISPYPQRLQPAF